MFNLTIYGTKKLDVNITTLKLENGKPDKNKKTFNLSRNNTVRPKTTIQLKVEKFHIS